MEEIEEVLREKVDFDAFEQGLNQKVGINECDRIKQSLD